MMQIRSPYSALAVARMSNAVAVTGDAALPTAARTGGASTSQAGGTQRNDFLDYLKGVLIVLVVYGHVIQNFAYRTNSASFQDPIFQFIYIFHMPLFMMVSGYLSEKTFKKYQFVPFFQRKVYQLIYPVLSWAFLLAIFSMFLQKEFADLRSLPISFVKSFILNTVAFWFIWALFLGFLAIFIARSFGKLENAAILAFNVLVLFLPDSHGIENLKFVFPFFCIGYLISKANLIPFKFNNIAYGFTLLLTLAIYLKWDANYFVYVSGMKPTAANAPIMLYRFVTGFIVSVAVYETLRRLHAAVPSPLLTFLGKNTLALYIVEVFFLRLADYLPQTTNLFAFHLLIGPIATALIIVLVLQIVKLISQNQAAKLYFLGLETRKATAVS